MNDILDTPDGLSIHIRASLGGEQSFQLTNNVLTFQSNGPIYDWASGQILLSQEQVDAIYTLLRKVRVSPIPMNTTVGLDGETTTVKIKQGQNRVELEYWEVPKPWKPLEKLAEMVRNLAEKAEDKSGTT